MVRGSIASEANRGVEDNAVNNAGRMLQSEKERLAKLWVD